MPNIIFASATYANGKFRIVCHVSFDYLIFNGSDKSIFAVFDLHDAKETIKEIKLLQFQIDAWDYLKKNSYTTFYARDPALLRQKNPKLIKLANSENSEIHILDKLPNYECEFKTLHMPKNKFVPQNNISIREKKRSECLQEELSKFQAEATKLKVELAKYTEELKIEKEQTKYLNEELLIISQKYNSVKKRNCDLKELCKTHIHRLEVCQSELEQTRGEKRKLEETQTQIQECTNIIQEATMKITRLV